MKKDFFDSIVLDMGSVAKWGLCQEDIISDQDIIARIEKISDLEQKDRDGRTLLINAATNGRAEVVKYLLNRGASISAKDDADFTSLHAGVLSNVIKTVELLLEAGADVNAKNRFGNGPIMIGNYETDLDIFRVLIANGADPEQKNNYGVSAKEIFACAEGISEILNQK